MHCDDKGKKRMKKAEGSEVKKKKLTSAEMMQIIEKNHDKSARAVMKHLPLADGPPEGLVDFGIMMIDKYRKVQDQLERNDENDSREKKAIGSVIKKATEGADSLLSEARKDVVAARSPEPAVDKSTEEMAEAVSKVKGSAEETAVENAETVMKDATKLVNSFEFSSGNKKMDKQFIIESLNEVEDSAIVETKQGVAEFITDLHRTQMDEEGKPLLGQNDFKKLNAFVSDEPREGRAEGGLLEDVQRYLTLYEGFEESLDKAKTAEDKKRAYENFKKHADTFEQDTVIKALQTLDESDGKREQKMFGGIIHAIKGDNEGNSILEKMAGIIKGSNPSLAGKIMAEGENTDESISNLEGPDPIEPSNNMASIGYAEGGSVDMPEDTYSNIPEDEMDEVLSSQLPDNEMEEEYTDYVLSEALDEKEQEYLMAALEQDGKLSSIFDKVMGIAGEFAGDGAVEGPGDGTSDSIPARLSDGEFVFTKKSVDVIGADELQEVMDDAERDYDEDREMKYGGGMMDSLLDGKDYDEEVHNQMLSANAMPSVKR